MGVPALILIFRVDVWLDGVFALVYSRCFTELLGWLGLYVLFMYSRLTCEVVCLRVVLGVGVVVGV